MVECARSSGGSEGGKGEEEGLLLLLAGSLAGWLWLSNGATSSSESNCNYVYIVADDVADVRPSVRPSLLRCRRGIVDRVLPCFDHGWAAPWAAAGMKAGTMLVQCSLSSLNSLQHRHALQIAHEFAVERSSAQRDREIEEARDVTLC